MGANNIDYAFFDNQKNFMEFSKYKIDGYIHEKKLLNGIYFLKTDINIKQQVQLDSSTSVNGLVLGYNLKGESSHESMISNLKLKVKENTSNILLIKDEQSSSSAQKGNLNKINIIIKNNFIEEYFPNSQLKDKFMNSLQKNICYELLVNKEISSNIKIILNEIYNNPFQNNLDKLFIESRILELIHIEFNNLLYSQKSDNLNLKLDKYDLEALEKAKNILISNMRNPPSIIELSKLVKLNDFKLKAGFKKVYKDSPFNILINYKLEYAKKLLQESDLNVNEIANEIGYKHTASFTTAFFKKFKILPKDLMKSRTYHYKH